MLVRSYVGNPNNCLPTVNFWHFEDSRPAAPSGVLPASSSAVLPLLGYSNALRGPGIFPGTLGTVAVQLQSSLLSLD